MPEAIRVVQYGLGPIGRAIARLVDERTSLELVGGIDVDPALIGRDLGEVLGLGRALGVAVSDDARGVLARTSPQVVLHSTSSSLATVRPQIEICLDEGVDVVSTCEELAYPRAEDPAQAEDLDRLAVQHGVTVLGTGVNPGYAMDALPLMLTAACQEVERIEVDRVVDAAGRRLPLQRKIGAGLSPDEFAREAEARRIRHVGLLQSLWMIADALGWNLDTATESLKPLIAERQRRSPDLVVQPGQVAGIHQRAVGIKAGREAIVLDLKMFIEAEEPRDEVRIAGRPPLHVRVDGGIHGDLATAAIVVNCIPRVLDAPPGLLTMKDVPLPHYWTGLEAAGPVRPAVQ